MSPSSIVTCLHSNDENPNLITEIQRIVDSVHAFTDADDCIEFLTELKNERVLVIVSATLHQHTMSSIERLAQVDSIYILCGEGTIDETLVSKLTKVKGVFAHIQDICDLLQRDKDLVSSSIVPETDSTDSRRSQHGQTQPEISSDNRMIRTISSHTPFAHLVENSVVICLDLNDNMETKWFSEVQRTLNLVNTFTAADECVDFLTDIENENILMIVSGDLSRHAVSHIVEFHQLKSIYVLSRDRTLHEEWTNQFDKVKGVFTTIHDILPLLKRNIQQFDQALIPISIIRANASASIALNELDQSFMYTQLVKELLLKIKFDNESKQNFIDFCRRQYRNDLSTGAAIDRFDREYDIHSPIWWYSKEVFIYSILNRALRIQDVNTILLMGFFIQDLHHQIEHLYKNWSDKPNHMIVYRGQVMLKSDFEKLQKAKGGLLSFNNFLSTSVDREVSYCFVDIPQSEPDLVGVLFEIKLNPELVSTPFFPLDNISHHRDEGEITILHAQHLRNL